MNNPEVTLSALAGINPSPIMPPSPYNPPQAMEIQSDSDSDSDEDPRSKVLKCEEDWRLWEQYLNGMGGGMVLAELKVADINEKHKRMEEAIIAKGGQEAVLHVKKMKEFLPVLKKMKANQLKAEREKAKQKRERKKQRKQAKKTATVKGFHYRPNEMGEEVVVFPAKAWKEFVSQARLLKK
jgi:hypothetical protein